MKSGIEQTQTDLSLTESGDLDCVLTACAKSIRLAFGRKFGGGQIGNLSTIFTVLVTVLVQPGMASES
jgi:hypothetical protein